MSRLAPPKMGDRLSATRLSLWASAYENAEGISTPIWREPRIRHGRRRKVSREGSRASENHAAESARGDSFGGAEGSDEAISYGMPAFKYKGMLVAYAAFANHCSFFPASGDLLKEFAEQLKDYPCSKGTIRFAMDKPLPAALIRKIVKARVAKNEAKKKY